MTVAVGASAGGLDACKQLFAELPADSGMAFAVVLHLDPSRESHLADILAQNSKLAVSQVTGPQRLEPDHIYVVAPNTSLHIENGALRPAPFEVAHGERKPIDLLFSSLALARSDGAAAIVLSGIGDDGSRALEDVRRAGGLCIAQDPDTAQHPSMPQCAIDTGLIDAVLPPEAMADFLAARVAHPRPPEPQGRAPSRERAPAPEGFAGILDLLAKKHGLDSHAYKAGTLRRRAERRLTALMPAASWQDYLEYLWKHPDEVAALYRDVLIGVTEFFRDAKQWDYLDEEVVPRLLDERGDSEWSCPVSVDRVHCYAAANS